MMQHGPGVGLPDYIYRYNTGRNDANSMNSRFSFQFMPKVEKFSNSLAVVQWL